MKFSELDIHNTSLVLNNPESSGLISSKISVEIELYVYLIKSVYIPTYEYIPTKDELDKLRTEYTVIFNLLQLKYNKEPWVVVYMYRCLTSERIMIPLKYVPEMEDIVVYYSELVRVARTLK